MGFLTNPQDGAKFLEACLPAKLVAEAKAAAASKSDQPELPLAAPAPAYPVLVEDAKDEGLTQKQLTEMSREELLEALKKNASE